MKEIKVRKISVSDQMHNLNFKNFQPVLQGLYPLSIVLIQYYHYRGKI